MTVAQLIGELQQFPDDKEIYVSQLSRYGSNYAYTIDGVKTRREMTMFWGSDKEDVVVIALGEQVGAIQN